MALSLAIVSCKKEEETTTPTPKGEVVPSSFTKKVMIEEFTGEWCGYCPSGAAIIKTLISNNPNKVYAAAIHSGDFMKMGQLDVIKTFMTIGGYPRAAIDRIPATNAGSQNGKLVMSRGYWTSNVATALARTANCGLKLETSLSGSNADITVKCGANTSLSNLRLTVYITEDGVPESSPGAQSGAGPGYINEDVLRKVLTDGKGDAIDLSSSELVEIKFSNIDLSAYNTSKVKVLAFIHKFDQSSPDYEILNVQEIHVGHDKNWD